MTDKNRRGTRVQTKQNENGLQAHFEQVEEYSIFPSGEFLHQLHQIDPSLPAQILQESKETRLHRQQLENRQLDENIRINTELVALDNRQLDLFSKGQWFGLSLALGLVSLAAYGMYLGNTTAVGLAIAAIVGVLVIYVLRQQPKSNQNSPQ